MGMDYAINTNSTLSPIVEQNCAQPQLWLPAYPVTQRTYLTAPNYIWSKTIQQSEMNEQKAQQTQCMNILKGNGRCAWQRPTDVAKERALEQHRKTIIAKTPNPPRGRQKHKVSRGGFRKLTAEHPGREC